MVTWAAMPDMPLRQEWAFYGAWTTAAAGTVAWFLVLADGSLLARMGRGAEESVGDELRCARGIYGVLSGLPFERHDIDHVVLAPRGVVAVEVKYLFGERRSIERTYRLEAALEQTTGASASVRSLLRSHGHDVVVLPLLVLAGPAAPDLDGQFVLREGVRVVAWRDSTAWLSELVEHPACLDVSVAQDIAERLTEFQRRRWDYEREHAA